MRGYKRCKLVIRRVICDLETDIQKGLIDSDTLKLRREELKTSNRILNIIILDELGLIETKIEGQIQ